MKIQIETTNFRLEVNQKAESLASLNITQQVMGQFTYGGIKKVFNLWVRCISNNKNNKMGLIMVYNEK